MPQSRFALVVAGGSGSRMGSAIPKQFLCLSGLPVLMHTLNAFYSTPSKPAIYLVLPTAEHSYWKELCQKHSFTVPHTIVAGGETRFHSVKNGLAAIGGEGFVAIHDGVRPLITQNLIERCFETAERLGNAVPAVNPVESVRVGQLSESRKENRDLVWLAQTPQVFDLKLISECYAHDWQPDFTDDASVVEENGHKIILVEGERENIKITTPTDLLLAEGILVQRQKNSPS